MIAFAELLLHQGAIKALLRVYYGCIKDLEGAFAELLLHHFLRGFDLVALRHA